MLIPLMVSLMRTKWTKSPHHYPIGFVYCSRKDNKYNLLKLGRIRTVSKFKFGTHLFLGSV